MKAALNKAIHCCDSEVDGQMAGLTVSYEDVLVALHCNAMQCNATQNENWRARIRQLASSLARK